MPGVGPAAQATHPGVDDGDYLLIGHVVGGTGIEPATSGL